MKKRYGRYTTGFTKKLKKHVERLMDKQVRQTMEFLKKKGCA